MTYFLQERGIHKAAQRLGWRRAETGWVYPYCSPDGIELGMRRRVDGHKPRWCRRATDGAYRKHPNAKLYHGRHVRWSEEMWGTEGETDCLTAREAGIESVTSIFGANAIPKDLGFILSRKGVKRLKLLCHNDKYGLDWAQRIISLL